MADRIPFRARAGEVSRLEAFSDVVFGFAISVLVVSLEAPKSFDQLMQVMRGFPAFAISFLLFFQVWWEHHKFFKRYALQDPQVVALNTLLLFVALFYVYPLKFVFTLFMGSLAGESTEPMNAERARVLFSLYGMGFTAVFWTLGALYSHAFRRRAELDLNAVEENDTRESVWDNFATGAFGVLSIAVAQSGSPGLAGWIYFLLFIPKTAVPSIFRDRRRKLEDRLLAR